MIIQKCYPFVKTVTHKVPSQCSRQLGVANTDTIAVALAAGCLCSKIGDVQQAEKLLRQAYAGSKAAAEARVMQCFTDVW
jgi:hypothetical protein